MVQTHEPAQESRNMQLRGYGITALRQQHAQWRVEAQPETKSNRFTIILPIIIIRLLIIMTIRVDRWAPRATPPWQLRGYAILGSLPMA